MWKNLKEDTSKIHQGVDLMYWSIILGKYQNIII